MTASKEPIDKVFAELCAAEPFIRQKHFEKHRFEESEFTSYGVSLKSVKGFQISIAFNMSDDSPDVFELYIMFVNKVSKVQIGRIAENIAIKNNREIHSYAEPDTMALCSYFALDEAEKAARMLMDIMQETYDNLIFAVN